MSIPRQSPMEQLIAILTGQRDCYAALLRLAERKHQAIIADDIQTIEHIVQQEQAMITTLGRMDHDRTALADQIAVHLQIPIDQLNVTSVLEHVDPFTRRVLARLRDEIMCDLERVEALNHTNSELLEKALRRVNRSMQILGVNAQKQTTYKPGAQQNSKQSDSVKATLFDKKI